MEMQLLVSFRNLGWCEGMRARRDFCFGQARGREGAGSHGANRLPPTLREKHAKDGAPTSGIMLTGGRAARQEQYALGHPEVIERPTNPLELDSTSACAIVGT